MFLTCATKVRLVVLPSRMFRGMRLHGHGCELTMQSIINNAAPAWQRHIWCLATSWRWEMGKVGAEGGVRQVLCFSFSSFSSVHSIPARERARCGADAPPAHSAATGEAFVILLCDASHVTGWPTRSSQSKQQINFLLWFYWHCIENIWFNLVETLQSIMGNVMYCETQCISIRVTEVWWYACITCISVFGHMTNKYYIKQNVSAKFIKYIFSILYTKTIYKKLQVSHIKLYKEFAK